MAETNKTTRGTNFVRNFGRAVPTMELIVNWVTNHLGGDSQLQAALAQFFEDQAGADDQLKFWHVGVKQFPKWNEILADNSMSALDMYVNEYRDIGTMPPANDLQKPTGTTDHYLHPDPMSRGNYGMPFIIIHTRELKNVDAARAALVAIDHDECLRDLFQWRTVEMTVGELGMKEPWHGESLLGLSSDNQDELKKAKKKWYIPKERSKNKDKSIVIVSDSVVRTLNWHLQEFRAGFEFDVHRLDDLRNRIRSKQWPMPSCLKSYRIDWPVVRNIEEAALITKRSQTALLTEFISKHAGQFVCDYLKKQYYDTVAHSEKHKNDEDFYGPEPYEVEEDLQEQYSKYKRVVVPFKDQVVPKLEFEETSTEVTSTKLKLITQLQKDFAQHYLRLKESSPELFGEEHKGGHTVQAGSSAITIDRVSPAPSTAIEDAQLVQAAIASPIPFPKARPAIYDHVHGELGPEGTPVTEDFSSVRFVGYEITLSEDSDTYESLAKQANVHCEKHFPPSLYAMGGFDVTPKMLKWANQNRILAKKLKIICPDPRTVPAKYRK